MATHFQRQGKSVLGVDRQDAIKTFFGGNAIISILVLGGICFFLLKEAFLFFPAHHQELKVYRLTGQEYVQFIKDEVDEYTEIVSLTNQAYFQELDKKFATERGFTEGFGVLTGLLEDEAEDELDNWFEAQDEVDDAVSEQEKEAANQNLTMARQAWDEKVELILSQADRQRVDAFGRLDDPSYARLLAETRTWNPVADTEPSSVVSARKTIQDGMEQFKLARAKIQEAGSQLRGLRNEYVSATREIRAEVTKDDSAAARKKALLQGVQEAEDSETRASLQSQADAIKVRETFPYAERIEVLDGIKPKHTAAVQKLESDLTQGVRELPTSFVSENAGDLISEVREKLPVFKDYLADNQEKAAEWSYDKPLGWITSLAAFFLGTDWVTNSSWHDFYGLLPLFTGSLAISFVALVTAIPFSIAAAIYVNRLAGPKQQNFIKPVIELIEAIPSVVLGFFGIMVLGEAMRDLSQTEFLSWVPGFPMSERLNILNAGLLLALMAVPTMFTLCEDALNNVPRSFSEASLALGASKLQTVVKIVVPTAVSGIFAAILLGFGRVIGETMVVLLVAGNQIAIPDLSEGLGVFFEPAHTMTGIIAQEMGEVTSGTLHYRALFSVGLVLFTISLLINIIARKVISRFSLKA